MKASVPKSRLRTRGSMDAIENFKEAQLETVALPMSKTTWMDVKPTLSQTWTRLGGLVRNMRSKCRCSYVLQFTFRHAVSCVLHRPPSQVIHCTVLFSTWFFSYERKRKSKSFSTKSFTAHHGVVRPSKPEKRRRRFLSSSNLLLGRVKGALHLTPQAAREQRESTGAPSLQTWRSRVLPQTSSGL